MLIVEIHAETAANHHAVPTGACEWTPDVRQGALGGRRAWLDVVTSGSGSEGGYQGFRELLHPGHEKYVYNHVTQTRQWLEEIALLPCPPLKRTLLLPMDARHVPRDLVQPAQFCGRPFTPSLGLCRS